MVLDFMSSTIFNKIGSKIVMLIIIYIVLIELEYCKSMGQID